MTYKQKSIVLTEKALEIVKNYMENYNKSKEKQISFNKALNNIVEQHEKVINSKQLQKTLTNIEKILTEYITNRIEYIITNKKDV